MRSCVLESSKVPRRSCPEPLPNRSCDHEFERVMDRVFVPSNNKAVIEMDSSDIEASWKNLFNARKTSG